MKKLLIILLISISTTLLAQKAPQKDYDECNTIIQNARKTNLSKDLINIELENCANKGNKYCSLFTGITYFQKEDDVKAFKYLSDADYEFKTYDNGQYYWIASFYLGTLYFGGMGVPANNEKAIEQFKHCTQNGKAMCAMMLSTVYDVSFRNKPVLPYAWMQVARKMGMVEVPGRKYVTVPQTIEMMQDNLTVKEREEGDKLAHEICATTPKCDVNK